MSLSINECFNQITDPRSKRNQRHPLSTLIGTSFLAALCGIDSFSGIQDFVEMQIEALEQYFDFPYGLPSHDTYQRLWNTISSFEFQSFFQQFLSSIEKVVSDIISIDGKTIRNSCKDKALHIVSAWCHKNQMVFGQEKVDSKSDEITAIPNLLEMLDLENKIITIDAMGPSVQYVSKLFNLKEIM